MLLVSLNFQVKHLFKSEVPNIVLEAANTGSTIKPDCENMVSKKPSSQLPYRIMWYKRSHTLGLRRSIGNRKQLFSFGEKGMSKENLIKVGKKLVDQMSAGDVAEADGAEAANQMMGLM